LGGVTVFLFLAGEMVFLQEENEVRFFLPGLLFEAWDFDSPDGVATFPRPNFRQGEGLPGIPPYQATFLTKKENWEFFWEYPRANRFQCFEPIFRFLCSMVPAGAISFRKLPPSAGYQLLFFQELSTWYSGSAYLVATPPVVESFFL